MEINVNPDRKRCKYSVGDTAYMYHYGRECKDFSIQYCTNAMVALLASLCITVHEIWEELRQSFYNNVISVMLGDLQIAHLWVMFIYERVWTNKNSSRLFVDLSVQSSVILVAVCIVISLELCFFKTTPLLNVKRFLQS